MRGARARMRHHARQETPPRNIPRREAPGAAVPLRRTRDAREPAAANQGREARIQGLDPPVTEIPDLMPLRARLGFVARFGPAAGAPLEIARALRQPFILVAVAAHHHQRVLQIDRMVGAEAELAAGLELRRDQVERAVVHHPPLGVARLGPGVGMEEIDQQQRPVRHPPQHIERVAHV